MWQVCVRYVKYNTLFFSLFLTLVPQILQEQYVRQEVMSVASPTVPSATGPEVAQVSLLVTSVTGPQTQTFNQSSPTPQVFAKSWLPGMGMDTLFMVPLQLCVQLKADVWALGMLSKVITLQGD